MNRSPKTIEVNIDELLAYFTYDPDTGLLRRRIASGTAKPGDLVGALMKNGYLNASFKGRKLLVHRIAFAIHYGRWPSGDVDHINGLRNDNRIANIREATRSQNMRNTGAHVDGATGIKGVHFYRKRGKYTAQICIEGRLIHLGYFDSEVKAKAAYREASEKHHGEFAREGE